MLQVTAGTRGKFAGDWDFDVYAQYGQNDRTERQTNNVSLSKLQDLAFAPDGGVSICSGGFNPYVAGSLSSDCARYVAVDAANAITLRQSLAEASVTGPLWSLPAGELSAAIGVFYKRDEFEYDADEALSKMLPGVPGVIGPRPDIAGFAAAPDRAGDESNTDAYVELRAPVLKDRPARMLELGLGYRYSDYSQAGGVSSYKAELLYRPVSPLRLRGSYQHAVRAPSIEELYFPPVSNQFIVPVPDPCDVDSAARTGPDRAQVEALCLAQGVPAALLPNYTFELRRVDGVSGGNPDLESEQADTYTFGIRLDVDRPPTRGSATCRCPWTGTRSTSTTASGAGTRSRPSRVASTRSTTRAYDNGNVYCSFFTRDAITGNIFAQILDRNIGGLETAGVDVQFDWGFAAGPGTLGLNALLTYVDHWSYFDPSGLAIEYAGTVGGGGLGAPCRAGSRC